MATQRDRRRGACGWLRRLVLGGVVASMGSCFSPHSPPCAFTCVTTPECPDGYACGTDGLCHRDGATEVCGLHSPYDGGVAGAGGGGVAGGGGSDGNGAAGAGGNAAGGAGGAGGGG